MPILKSFIIFMPLLCRGRRMPKKLFVWHWWFSFPQSCQLATPKYKLVLPSPMAGCLLGKNKLISSQTDHGVGDLSKYIIFLKCPPNPPQIRQQLSKTFFNGLGGCSCDGNHNDGGERAWSKSSSRFFSQARKEVVCHWEKFSLSLLELGLSEWQA